MDLITMNLSVILVLIWANGSAVTLPSEYVNFWLWLNISWISVTWAINTYQEKFILSNEIFSKRSFRAYCTWIVLIFFYYLIAQPMVPSSRFLVAVLISQSASLFFNRFIYFVINTYFKRNNYFRKKVLIVGYNDTAKKLASYLERDGMHSQIVGFCEEPENVHELSNYPIIDSVGNAIVACRRLQVSEIYSTISPEHNRSIYGLMREADQSCIHFWIIPDMSRYVNGRIFVNHLNDMPVLSLRHEPLNDIGNRIIKRLFDIFFSAVIILFILSWLVPLIGLLIFIDSGGPVFFTQARSGKGKAIFTCLKFRSMKLNDEADTRQTSKDDDRLTRIGRFLRKTNLDEFPQFFNVLMGDMSIVGPRPHMLKHTDDYSKLIDQYMIRQFLKPGITGWAQICGFRGETKTLSQMRARVERDIWYMENWTFWLDIRIIFVTAYNMIMGDRNAF